MVADALTKSLPYPSFKKHRATMMGEEVKQSKTEIYNEEAVLPQCTWWDKTELCLIPRVPLD